VGEPYLGDVGCGSIADLTAAHRVGPLNAINRLGRIVIVVLRHVQVLPSKKQAPIAQGGPRIWIEPPKAVANGRRRLPPNSSTSYGSAFIRRQVSTFWQRSVVF
jgi:hypothetical protein